MFNMPGFFWDKKKNTIVWIGIKYVKITIQKQFVAFTT